MGDAHRCTSTLFPFSLETPPFVPSTLWPWLPIQATLKISTKFRRGLGDTEGAGTKSRIAFVLCGLTWRDEEKEI